MVTCPNCGHVNREGQRFCGSCGTDLQAALASTAPANPIGEDQGTPYAYSQSPGSTPGYGYEYPPAEPSSNSRLIILGVALVIAACCIFACGLTFGFEIIPDLLGIGGGAAAPRPTPTPTPTSLLPILYYFFA